MSNAISPMLMMNKLLVITVGGALLLRRIPQRHQHKRQNLGGDVYLR
jgi:hypothetical protein